MALTSDDQARRGPLRCVIHKNGAHQINYPRFFFSVLFIILQLNKCLHVFLVISQRSLEMPRDPALLERVRFYISHLQAGAAQLLISVVRGQVVDGEAVAGH